MTQCPDAKDLHRYADGELRGRRRLRIALHVEKCDLCARELEHLRRVGELIAGAIRRETDSHDLTGLWKRVAAGVASPPLPRKGWNVVFSLLWKPAARVAYAAAIVLLAGFFFVRPLLLGPGQPVAIGQARVHSVYQYDPDVTVTMLVASGDKAAIVWISGVERTEEN
jgi:anti-sigma factor RsiW